MKKSRSTSGEPSSATWMARMKELEEENHRLRRRYIEEKLKAEVVAEALAKKW